MKKTLHVLFCIVLFCVTGASLFAQSPRISIQGILKDANGVSVSDGNYAITFRLYNEPTGGTPLWEEQANVEVVGGIYSHYLGGVTPLRTSDFASVVYVAVRVGTFELTPRSELTYAPYTFASATVVCSGAVGDVKYSILDPVKFAQVNGDCWVPMDGRTLAQEDALRQLTGMTNLPNGGGLFIRMQDFANSDNDPGRDVNSPIAVVQGDDVKPHNHTMSEAGQISSPNILEGSFNVQCANCYTNIRLVGQGNYTTGNHVHTINNNDGAETRPKNLNLWGYIRIN